MSSQLLAVLDPIRPEGGCCSKGLLWQRASERNAVSTAPRGSGSGASLYPGLNAGTKVWFMLSSLDS